jgi:hypothetical protein
MQSATTSEGQRVQPPLQNTLAGASGNLTREQWDYKADNQVKEGCRGLNRAEWKQQTNIDLSSCS